MGYLPEPVRELTRTQRSIITRAQLLELGASRGSVSRWLAQGYLEPLHRGVYVVGGAAVTPTARLDAAVRRAGSHARAGGASALALHDLDGFRFTQQEGLDRPFVVLPPGRWLENVDFDWVAVELPAHACADLCGIPCVSVAEGLVQSAEAATKRQLRVAFDDAVRRKLVSGRELERACRRLDGRLAGAEVVAELVAEGVLLLESEPERELAGLFGPDDPQPVFQVWIGRYRVDAVFVEARLVLEYQGQRFHTSEADRRADEARAAHLRRAHDIVIIEVRAKDLANPVALRDRILDERTRRLRQGVTPLRDYRVAQR